MTPNNSHKYGRKCPEVDETIRRLNADGWSDRRIGVSLGVDHVVVLMKRRRLGIPPAHKVGWGSALARHTAGDVSALTAAGWGAAPPAGMSPRQFRVVLSILTLGPLTAREVARAVGNRAKAGLRGSALWRVCAAGYATPVGLPPRVYALTPKALDMLASAGKEAPDGRA
jgi:hypothetical protein